MQIIIREAALEDAAAINNLSWQLGYTPTVEATAGRMHAVISDKKHVAFVAVAEGRVIGWIHGFYTMRLESDPFVEIGGLVVDIDARESGVGRKLMQQVIEWCKQESIAKIRVRTNAVRLETHRFYRKLGFSETKEQKVFDLKL